MVFRALFVVSERMLLYIGSKQIKTEIKTPPNTMLKGVNTLPLLYLPAPTKIANMIEDASATIEITKLKNQFTTTTPRSIVVQFIILRRGELVKRKFVISCALICRFYNFYATIFRYLSSFNVSSIKLSGVTFWLIAILKIVGLHPDTKATPFSFISTGNC